MMMRNEDNDFANDEMVFEDEKEKEGEHLCGELLKKKAKMSNS